MTNLPSASFLDAKLRTIHAPELKSFPKNIRSGADLRVREWNCRL